MAKRKTNIVSTPDGDFPEGFPKGYRETVAGMKASRAAPRTTTPYTEETGKEQRILIAIADNVDKFCEALIGAAEVIALAMRAGKRKKARKPQR